MPLQSKVRAAFGWFESRTDFSWFLAAVFEQKRMESSPDLLSPSSRHLGGPPPPLRSSVEVGFWVFWSWGAWWVSNILNVFRMSSGTSLVALSASCNWVWSRWCRRVKLSVVQSLLCHSCVSEAQPICSVFQKSVKLCTHDSLTVTNVTDTA